MSSVSQYLTLSQYEDQSTQVGSQDRQELQLQAVFQTNILFIYNLFTCLSVGEIYHINEKARECKLNSQRTNTMIFHL